VGLFVVVTLVALGMLAVAPGDSDPGGAPTRTLELSLGDYFIRGDLEIPAGAWRVNATNVGVEPHNVGIRGKGITANLFRGQRADLDVVLEPGSYELFCDVSDHVARGMVASLVVTESVTQRGP
jgi:hypothetical protein